MAFVPPTEDELAEVQAMKEVISSSDEAAAAGTVDELTDTAYLRFWRGRKKVMADCEASLVSHLKWRGANKVKDFESFECPNEMASRKSYLFGKDKNNNPVVYVFARRHDKNNRDTEEIARFIIYLLMSALKESDPTQERIVIVFDLTNFGLRCMDYEAVKILIGILAQNFPDVLACIHIINHPWLFNACWAVIRPWIDPVTAEKVNFTRIKDLPQFIDPEHIPKDVGDETN